MQLKNFKRIVTTFADEDSGLATDRDGTLLLEIRGLEVEAHIRNTTHGVEVEHEGIKWSAEQWIYLYLAKLDRLADRIINSVSPTPYYVSPRGRLLNLEGNMEREYADLGKELRKNLNEHPIDTTLIYFLTSDAGEGKTSLIEQISVDQAKAYKNKTASTLILPVPLGGRPFLRFDDAVIASLSNRFRFPFLYYDSFLELVKMGAIIPAFDGYEEMLSQSESGEAVSAIGNLADQLSSSGTLLVAARKAYFDSSLSSQSKLLDPVRKEQKVEIRRFILDRWSRKIFLNYAEKRRIPQPEQLYDRVKDRLKDVKDRSKDKGHPVLTRAVLVRRLMDVAEQENDLDKFLLRLGQSKTGYFFDFVEDIVDREVTLKWIDTSGTGKPLLTQDEHHELLSKFAFEMWVSGVETLGLDIIRLVVQFFGDEKDIAPKILRQIHRRINDHSLLRMDDTSTYNKRIRFDHEDFREFYLGQALARALESGDDITARMILDARQLSKSIIEEVARYLTVSENSSISYDRLFDDLHQLSREKQLVSYIQENCGALMLELAERTDQRHLITGVSFPANALDQRGLKDLNITRSFFNSTGISGSNIRNCTFEKCRFVELALNGMQNLNGTVFDQCTFDSVSIGDNHDIEYRKFFNPDRVIAILSNHGFELKSQQKAVLENPDPTPMDEDMKIALRFIRLFARSTAVPENTVRTRIGVQSGHFFNTILPKLQRAQLVLPAEGPKNRLRLMVPLSQIDRLVENSENSFEQFIANASSP